MKQLSSTTEITNYKSIQLLYQKKIARTNISMNNIQLFQLNNRLE